MQHAILKLVALATVVGIGVLILVQAQRGLNELDGAKIADQLRPSAFDESDETSPSRRADDEFAEGDGLPAREHGADQASDDDVNFLADHQMEPEMSDEGDDEEPVDALAKLGRPSAVARNVAGRQSNEAAADSQVLDLDDALEDGQQTSVQIRRVAAESAASPRKPAARSMPPRLAQPLDGVDDSEEEGMPGKTTLLAPEEQNSEEAVLDLADPIVAPGRLRRGEPGRAPGQLSAPEAARRALVRTSAEDDDEVGRVLERLDLNEDETEPDSDDASFGSGGNRKTRSQPAALRAEPTPRRPAFSGAFEDDETPREREPQPATGAFDDEPVENAPDAAGTSNDERRGSALEVTEADDEPPVIERVAPKRRKLSPGGGRPLEEEEDDGQAAAPPMGSQRKAASLSAEIEPEPDEPALVEPPAAAPVQPDADDRRSTRHVPRPQVTIDKIAPATAALGQPMVYKIIVKNKGALPVLKVGVEDVLPEGMKIEGSIPQARRDGKKLSWQLGTLEPGAEKTIAVRVVPQTEGTKGGVATVSYITESNPNRSGQAPHLVIEALGPAQAAAGSTVTLKFRIKNLGRSDATGVVIRDVLPAALRHPEGDDLEFEVGMLPAGAVREVVLEVTAAQAGRTLNRAIVTADGNVSEESVQQIEVTGPALRVERTGPRRLAPGKRGAFTNRITNPGPAAVTNVHVVETLPAGMEFVEASDSAEHNPARRTVTWNIDRLEPHASASVGVTLAAQARGAQIGVVRAYDASGASGEAVGTTLVAGAPALSIDLGELPALAETGEQLTVPVKIINRGTDAATNVRAVISLPAGIQLVSASGPVSYEQVNVGVPIGSGNRGFRQQKELRFAAIKSIDARESVSIELVLQPMSPGNRALEIEVSCDQFEQPVRRAEATTVIAPDREAAAR